MLLCGLSDLTTENCFVSELFLVLKMLHGYFCKSYGAGRHGKKKQALMVTHREHILSLLGFLGCVKMPFSDHLLAGHVFS